ncbi:Indoleamine 2,3-dioxygenase [Spinellus fusiger]|nr:Indoleamine 2,3-dioxygenase [Spinellus fusiger]
MGCGFLPEEPPLRRLPNAYYAPWEDLMEDCNDLLLAGKLRERVHKLPLLECTMLETVQEYRRAFLILCLVSHSYVWGRHEKVSETLPANVAIPWTIVADYLGLCPVVCHAAVVLWNYRLLDKEGPVDLSNLAVLATYSGSLDEAWFYLITTAIESSGAPCISAIVDSITAINNRDHLSLEGHLRTIQSALVDVNTNMSRMYEKCDPYVFYWKIRPYLAGWENMAEAGLPFGLIYEGIDSYWNAETEEYTDMSHLPEAERLLHQYRRYAGGSAAQSSLIATLDVAFGVEHHPTGEKPPVKFDPVARLNNDRYTHLPSTNPSDELTPASHLSSPSSPSFVRTNRNKFLRAMRKYMPKSHRNFLEDLEKSANLRPFMLQLQEQQQSRALTAQETTLMELYNDCLHQLKLFRDKHVQIVTLYIINQARKGSNIPHGGFAIENPKPEKELRAGDSQLTTSLYPQTALKTAPGIREGSASAKVSQLFPQLGLAKHVDPKTGVVRGTGGTNIMPFLKQSRDETNDMKLPIVSAQTSPPVLPETATQDDGAKPSKSFTEWMLRR